MTTVRLSSLRNIVGPEMLIVLRQPASNQATFRVADHNAQVAVRRRAFGPFLDLYVGGTAASSATSKRPERTTTEGRRFANGLRRVSVRLDLPGRPTPVSENRSE